MLEQPANLAIYNPIKKEILNIILWHPELIPVLKSESYVQSW